MNRKRPNSNSDICDGSAVPLKLSRYGKTFSFLPLELVEKILCYGDDKSILACRLVCRKWLDLIDEDVQFWTSLSKKRGVSVDGLPKKNGFNGKLIVNYIKGRFRSMYLCNGSTVVVKSNSNVVGTHDDGILVCLNQRLRFYSLSGILMYQFLLDLDEDYFDDELYKDSLVFEHPYMSPILTWTTNGEQIHLCTGNEVKIFNMSRQSNVILVDDLSSFIESNRNEMRLIFLPHNIRAIKKKAKTGKTSGISITFYSEDENPPQRALFLSDASKTLLILHHRDGDVDPMFSHNFSISGCGVHVKGGTCERSVDVFMGSNSLDESYMKVHSTSLFQVPGSREIDVKVNPIISLNCNPNDCSIATVGNTFIVLFNRAELSLMFYKRPSSYSMSAAVEVTLRLLIKKEDFTQDIDWESAEFVFYNDVNDGHLGDIGKVELRQCCCRENVNTFLVFCK